MTKALRQEVLEVFSPRLHQETGQAFAGRLKDATDRFDSAEFERLRMEYMQVAIADQFRKSDGRTDILTSDLTEAKAILAMPTAYAEGPARSAHVAARQSFSRFRKKFKIPNLDSRGGPRYWHGPVRLRLTKEAQDIVDSPASSQRLNLASAYIDEKIQRALALIDAINTGNSPIATLTKTGALLEKARNSLAD